MPSLLSRMSRNSNSTAVSGSSPSTPSMDMNTQLAPLPETRKRSRNLDLNLDSDNEEPPARNVMAPPRSRQSRIRSGRHTMSRQEQEQISSTFATIGAPNPAAAQSTPTSSRSRANHAVQASTTHRSHESTSQRRSRRRGARHNSVHAPAVPIENRNSESVVPPASNEASVIENQGPETASSAVSSVVLAIEALSNQIALTRRDTPYIALTLGDSSDEEGNDAALPPAPSVFPAVAAPPVQNSKPNADRKFFDLTFEDSSDEEESAATMTQAYIGDRIVLVEEKRLEPFLPEPTIKFQRLLEDARTQKLHCLDKWYSVGYAVLGISGNVYTVIIEGSQFAIVMKAEEIYSAFTLSLRDVSREGYFNVAELLGIDKTVEGDAEARQSYQREVDRWRVEMVRRPTTLLEEVCDFIVRYHPEVYSDVGDVFCDESNDDNSPRAIRVLETMEIVEMNVERILQGLPTIDSEFTRDLHLL
ncbi:hypothetical protein BPAE_0034g00650 [Botrytis paeoniae]|uniref:Uncharacterized protein n=1 Tax=Botrytis paeoniae TaxID=278948 RepID=A0A4Z1FTY1_9HELO|nr:hypothetical protein BPAE_0034g00650 [Botrytis paeoniae]